MNAQLRESIFATIAFFDVFELPLTLMEVFLYTLDVLPESLSQVREILEADDRIAVTQGMYHLKGREENVILRHQRYALSAHKIKKVGKGLRALSRIPSIRGIFLCNNAGYMNLRPVSDVDLLIITHPGTLWTTRLCALVITQLYGLRIRNNMFADKLCLSFFVDGNHLDMSSFSQGVDDMYLRYWVQGCIPYFVVGDAYHHFIENNAWVRDRLPSYHARQITTRFSLVIPLSRIRIVSTSVVQLGESIARWIQRRAFSPEKWQRAQEHPQHVVISDTVLKFHDADKRAYYTSLWQSKLKS